jgi:hypothetical protein
MSRVVHFEIHAADPGRAAAFYRALFGWTITRWEGPVDYWLIRTGEAPEAGIDGGMVRRRGDEPVEDQGVNAYVCTVQIPELDPVLRRVPELGGAVVVPKMPIPGVGWLAYGKDTEGNIFGMMQEDPAAA